MSICCCWLLIFTLSTWTGMGTCILCPGADPCPLWLVPTILCPLTRFHLALLFWNQILICDSDSASVWANCALSVRLKYFFKWNSRSNSSSCSEEKDVLLLRLFWLLGSDLLFSATCLPSKFSSLGSSSLESLEALRMGWVCLSSSKLAVGVSLQLLAVCWVHELSRLEVLSGSSWMYCSLCSLICSLLKSRWLRLMGSPFSRPKEQRAGALS